MSLASLGVIVYSVHVGDGIFVITNVLVLLAGLTGLFLHVRNARGDG